MQRRSDVPNSAETDKASKTESAEHAHEGRGRDLAQTENRSHGGSGTSDLANGLLPGGDLLLGLFDLSGSLLSATVDGKQ